MPVVVHRYQQQRTFPRLFFVVGAFNRRYCFRAYADLAEGLDYLFHGSIFAFPAQKQQVRRGQVSGHVQDIAER